MCIKFGHQLTLKKCDNNSHEGGEYAVSSPNSQQDANLYYLWQCQLFFAFMYHESLQNDMYCLKQKPIIQPIRKYRPKYGFILLNNFFDGTSTWTLRFLDWQLCAPTYLEL